MDTLKSNMRCIFLNFLICFFLMACASIKPREAQWAAVQDIKVVDKEKTTHVGIFVPESVQKSVQEAASLDSSNLDEPPLLTVTLKNADIAETKTPPPEKIKSTAIAGITTSYEDVEDTTFAKINIALTNTYPYEVIDKPFGYEVIIQKDRPALEQFLVAQTENKEVAGDSEESSSEDAPLSSSEETPETLAEPSPLPASEPQVPTLTQYESHDERAIMEPA